MKKILSIMLIAALTLICAAACGNSASVGSGESQTASPSAANSEASGESAGTTSSGKPLVIGTMPLTVGVPVQHAYEQGYYKDEGLEIEIIIFPTGAPINEAYAAGQIDVAVSGLASVFSLALGNTHWIGEINSTGGMGIYARPDSPILAEKGNVDGLPEIYGSAELAKGMKILGPLGTVSQFSAMKYMEKFGLSSTDYEQVHMDYGPAYQAFVSGEGDAVALNPPFTFQAAEAGYPCIATFEDATGVSLMDGIFTSDSVINERRGDIEKFIKATYKACSDLQDDEVRYELSMRWFNENGKEYDENSLRSEMAVRDYIDADYMQQPDYIYGKGMLEIAEFFTSDGKIETDSFPNVVKSFDPSFIEQTLGISFTVQQ